MDWNEFLQTPKDRFPLAHEDELRSLERELGCTLPSEYREFLIKCNGGYCGGNLLFNELLPDGQPADVAIHHVYGIRDCDTLSFRRVRACYQRDGDVRIPLELLPIADDPCGNAICLGLQGKHCGAVYFWDHEYEPDPDTWDGCVETAGNIQLVARSFSEFVAGLGSCAEVPTDAPLVSPEERMCRDWHQLCDRLQLTGDVAAVWERLRDLYGQSWRAYHNLKHVDECLLTFGLCYALQLDRHAFQMAIWFHDAVYIVGAKDNEEQSAELARQCLSSLNASEAMIEHVANLIRATDHRSQPDDPEARLLCDIDLKILGRGVDIYDQYADAICTEVGLSEAEYAPHRQAFLQGMLAKEHIFHTDDFRRQYESAARVNMRRELERWTRLLAE